MSVFTHRPRILLITGTPGVGKSAVSKELAIRMNGLHIDLGYLVKNEGMSCGFDVNRKTLIADDKRIRMRINQIAREIKGCIIIDGHIAADVVKSKDLLLAFILRRNPISLREVLEERGFNNKKIRENVAAEILDVCLFDVLKAYGEEKVCEIDVSLLTIKNVVDLIIEIIEGKKQKQIGIVDWLKKLECEGVLSEYMNDL